MLNKNILITGATSGIGEALALYYAKNNAKNLFICGRSQDRLFVVQKECEKLGCKVFGRIIDVTNKDEMKDWIVECNNIAPLNLVIANAGVGTTKETDENIYNTFNINVNGVLNTVLPTIEIFKNKGLSNKSNDGSQSSLEQFIKRQKSSGQAFTVDSLAKKNLSEVGCEFYHQEDKSIAIVSSIAGYHGLPACPSYSASKACVKAWGEALRGSLNKDNINVSVICPGFVRSRITDKNTCAMPFFMEADVAAKIIAIRLEKKIGLISFPWILRFSTWILSILPNRLSQIIYNRLPSKTSN